MKIDFTVTKRDKNLLAGLAVCAAVFCFYWFGVKPQMDCLDKLEVQQEAVRNAAASDAGTYSGSSGR